MKRVGITGATGFVGRHLVNFLLNKGYRISALVLEDSPNLPKEVKTVRGDLARDLGIKEFLNGVDVCVHLAARIEVGEEKMFRDNVSATHNLIKAALALPIKQFIYMSTAAVYGNSRGAKFKESDFCFPNTEYGVTKYLSEKIVEYWSAVSGKPVTIFRPFNIYGPGNFKGIIYNFYKSIREEGKIVIYGEGKQTRDFMYVEDAINAVAIAIKKEKGGIFNIGSGETYTVLKLVDIFRKVLRKKITITFSPEESGKVFNISQDFRLVKRVLGWEPKVKLKEGLAKTIKWYEKNPNHHAL